MARIKPNYVLLQYDSAIDERFASKIRDCLIAKGYSANRIGIYQTGSFEDLISTAEGMAFFDTIIAIGAQDANAIYNYMVNLGLWRNVTEADAGNIFIQHSKYQNHNFYSVAGYDREDTSDIADSMVGWIEYSETVTPITTALYEQIVSFHELEEGGLANMENATNSVKGIVESSLALQGYTLVHTEYVRNKMKFYFSGMRMSRSKLSFIAKLIIGGVAVLVIGFLLGVAFSGVFEVLAEAGIIEKVTNEITEQRKQVADYCAKPGVTSGECERFRNDIERTIQGKRESIGEAEDRIGKIEDNLNLLGKIPDIIMWLVIGSVAVMGLTLLSRVIPGRKK